MQTLRDGRPCVREPIRRCPFRRFPFSLLVQLLGCYAARHGYPLNTKGPTSTLSYYGTTGDELLEQITATTHAGGALNQFGYAYNADQSITSFGVSEPTAETKTYGYDKARRLTSASSSALCSYGCDAASNILSMSIDETPPKLSYTLTNAIAFYNQKLTHATREW